MPTRATTSKSLIRKLLTPIDRALPSRWRAVNQKGDECGQAWCSRSRRTFKDEPLGLGRSFNGRVDQEQIWERTFGLISAHPFLMTAEGRDEPT